MRQHILPRWRFLCTRLGGVITQPASRNHFTAMNTWSSKGINIHDGPNWRREDKEFKVGPTKRAARLIRTKIKLARQVFFFWYNPDMRVCAVETRSSGFRNKACGQNQGRTNTYFIKTYHNSAVWPLYSQTDPCNKCLQTVHHTVSTRSGSRDNDIPFCESSHMLLLYFPCIRGRKAQSRAVAGRFSPAVRRPSRKYGFIC